MVSGRIAYFSVVIIENESTTLINYGSVNRRNIASIFIELEGSSLRSRSEVIKFVLLSIVLLFVLSVWITMLIYRSISYEISNLLSRWH